MVVVSELWLFDKYGKGTRSSQLENCSGIYNRSQQFSGNLVLLFGIWGTEPRPEDVQHVAHDVRLHLAQIVRWILAEVILLAGQDKGRRRLWWCLFPTHHVVTVLRKVEVELRPEGVKTTFVSDYLHTKQGPRLYSSLQLLLQRSLRFIGKILWPHNAILNVFVHLHGVVVWLLIFLKDMPKLPILSDRYLICLIPADFALVLAKVEGTWGILFRVALLL